MWAIVPIKRFDQAKQRLASVLSAPERKALMLAMARDVLSALSRCQRLSGILLVSRAQEAGALAEAFGLRQFAESAAAKLPDALNEARDHAVANLGARSIFIVHADAPLIDPAETDRIIAAHRGVTLLPDSMRIGTNGLICTPPDAIPFVFDGKSFNAHADHARQAGFGLQVVDGSGLALDIDTPADLAQLLRQGPSSQTGAYLRNSGIAERLAGVDNEALHNSCAQPQGQAPRT